MHIKLIKMLSILIVSSASIFEVYLDIKLTMEHNWKGDVWIEMRENIYTEIS